MACGEQVSLLVPWLARCDQDLVFPNNLSFETPEDQEVCMREWIKKRTGLSPAFDILWYSGADLPSHSSHRQHKNMHVLQACYLCTAFLLG